jgi:hypothetical protein
VGVRFFVGQYRAKVLGQGADPMQAPEEQ